MNLLNRETNFAVETLKDIFQYKLNIKSYFLLQKERALQLDTRFSS